MKTLPGSTRLDANEGPRNPSGHDLTALYGTPLPATRNGPLYTAFPYPTKISPEAIALYIATHTSPGATVFDGFAGSGTTGLAALLCEDPPEQLRNQAAKLGLRPHWGPRNAVLYELSGLGAFVANTLNNPPCPERFRDGAEHVLRDVTDELGWMYAAEDPDGGQGCFRHVVWSDVVLCPNCGHQAALWDACVSFAPARIAPLFHCPHCGSEHPVGALGRVTEQSHDDLTGDIAQLRHRTMGRIYGVTGRSTWSRSPTADDLGLLARIASHPIPTCVPKLRIPWGDLYRAGYHRGMSHLHHFYTRRNLIVFGRLWERASAHQGSLRDALRFWLLSYNASHATIMTRVVAKSGQKDLVVTSAQPGVLYVSGLPVEKNLLRGLGRKLSNITRAFESIHGRRAQVLVRQKSSRSVELPDNSIDYVFTDPPFGGNIPYAEISVVNEAWLGRLTDRTDEVIVSRCQRKTVETYQRLLTDTFTEVNRILRPGGNATLVFHSAKADLWNALQAAYTDAGFSVQHAGILDKIQGSFKQVTTKGAVRGDPVLMLERRSSKSTLIVSPWQVAADLYREAVDLGPQEQTPERLYSRLVSHFLANHREIPIDADEYYRWHLAQQHGDVEHDVHQ